MLMYCCDITVVMVGCVGVVTEYFSLMGWVGLGYENWTHGHVWQGPHALYVKIYYSYYVLLY